MQIPSFEGELKGLLQENFWALLLIMTFVAKKIKVIFDVKCSKFNPF